MELSDFHEKGNLQQNAMIWPVAGKFHIMAFSCNRMAAKGWGKQAAPPLPSARAICQGSPQASLSPHVLVFLPLPYLAVPSSSSEVWRGGWVSQGPC